MGWKSLMPRRDLASLNPAYWGSLTALLFGLLATGVHAFVNGTPAHIAHVMPVWTEHFFAILLLLIATVCLRYYLAVSVNIYGGNPGSFLKSSNTDVRKVSFFGNCLIIAFCNVAAAVLVQFSASLAFFVCAAIGFSAFLLAIMWRFYEHGKRENSQSLKSADKSNVEAFTTLDILIFAAMLWFAFSMLHQSDAKILMISVVAFTLVFFLVAFVDFKKRLARPFFDQVVEVKEALGDETSF